MGVFRLMETPGVWPSMYKVRPALAPVSIGKRQVLFGDDLLPRFTPVETSRYKTVGGPWFTSNLCCPCSGSVGLAQGILRLIGVRKPQVEGLDDALFANQERFFLGSAKGVEKFQSDLRLKVVDVFPQSEVILSIKTWAYATHPKRALRVRAFEEWESEGCPLVHGVRKNLVVVKVKTCEFLASHKPRVIGDLGVTASMMGGWMMDYFKYSMASGYMDTMVESYFLPSPDISSLRASFERLLYGTEKWCCVYYFSDDVICRILCSDGALISNADISACDGSHGPALMRSIEDFMMSCVPGDARPYVRLLFEQLELDFTCTPPGQTSERIKVKTQGVARLYSGSVLTTFMNNYAVSLASVKLNEILCDFESKHGMLPTKAQAKGFLEEAFREVGYLLEVDDTPTEQPRRLQFLKHSPAFIDGEIEPYLNLGVLFRGFGTVDSDYPGKNADGMEERVRRQNSGVVLSRVHAGEHCVAEAFRTAFPPRGGDAIVTSLKPHQVTTNDKNLRRIRIPTEELALRYDLSVAEIEHVASVVASSRQGELHYVPAVARFLELDYGIPLHA